MKFFGEKSDEQEETKPARSTPRKRTEDPVSKDPTRWLSLLFLFIFLFISYLSWVSFS